MDNENVPSSTSTSIFDTVKKVYKNITVEPLVICWLLPFLMTYAAIENMNLEKACRELVTSEIGFSKDVCKLFVRKDEYAIGCSSQDTSLTQFKEVDVDAIKRKYPEIFASIENKQQEVYKFLCDIENTVQEKISFINSIRNPISSIGPLVIILFAGPWSDKKNLRVPCMLVPLLGEAVGYFSLFIAAIFINGPVEFPAYAYRLLPSLTGAENLMVMGIFSYLSAISSDENRTFRFGMFQILMTIVPIFGQSIGPTLVKNFEYTELFGFMIPIHVIGLLYAFFYLKEVKKPKEIENAAYDNQAMTVEVTDISKNSSHLEETPQTSSSSHKNACVEFFDPQLAIYCIKSFIKKRENGLRQIIILFMLMHFVTYGVSGGEAQNLFLYVRSKLEWDVDKYVYHNVFTIISGLIGTSFAVGVLSKLFKVADIFLVILSTIMSIICRVVYILANKTIIFFIGTAIDFTYAVKGIAVRSIISKIVPSDDLSTMFAIMGLFEALSGFVFPYIYPTYYQFLLKSKSHDLSEIYMLSGILFIITAIVYLILWKLLRKKEEIEVANTKDEAKQNDEENTSL